MGIKTKMLLPTIALTLLVSAAILVSNIVLFSDYVDISTLERVSSASKYAENYLDTLKVKANAIALSIAGNRTILDSIEKGDRRAMLFQAMRLLDETEIDFCTISDANGRVLLRTHAPERYGDSVLGQANVRSALAGESLTVLEQGAAVLLSVRSGSPVLNDRGAVVGVISIGYRLDTDKFVDLIKELSGCEASVLLGDERVSTTHLKPDGTRALDTKADSHVSEKVLSTGEAYIGEADILGRPAFASYTPLTGPDGGTIGMLFTGQYVDRAARIIHAFVQRGSLIALAALAGFTAIILVIAGRIVTPIQAMTRAASALAAGDTDVDLNVTTKDEMGELAGAFSSMVGNTRRQVQIVEQIARGDMTDSLPVRSEKDLMNLALGKLNETIRAQAASIREEFERIKLMLDATPLVCRLWSRDFKLLECNEAAVKLFGVRDKQEYMDRYFELAPELQPDGQSTAEKVRQSVDWAFERGACTYDWMYQLPDGTPVPSETTLVRVPYGDGFVVAAYSRDMRAHKRMMADIEHRDNLLNIANRMASILFDTQGENYENIEAVLMESMELLGRSVDADRVHIMQNETREDELHFTCKYAWIGDSEESGRAFRVGMSVPYSTDSSWEEDFERGLGINGPVKDLRPASRQFFASFGARSVLALPIFRQGRFWGHIRFSDCRRERVFDEEEVRILHSASLLIVAAMNRAAQAARIREALADAEKATSAKSNFLAHMSHEIRTPLNAVIGLSELTLDEEGLSGEAGSNLEKISSAGSTILSIVNDILDISKIESGKFELYPVLYDTPSLLNDIVTLNIVRIGEKPITFRLDADENLPASLFGDDLRVKQIFNNLLSNAFKYTDAGAVDWRISFEREGADVWLVSSVRDTGLGISPENVRKLFSDYNQVDAKTNRRVDGTGLGLAITKRLVEMMGGTIAVESEHGAGSTFHVRLRQQFVSDKPIGKTVAENLTDLRYTLSKRVRNTKVARVDLSYAHVLVVDDIVTNLDVVKGMLKPYGLKVDCASCGRQAVEMVRAESPRYSALFMDHMMPGMDGVEATRIIREEIGTEYARSVPIIALTANAISGNEEMFLSKGFQDFISKPIDTAKLDAVLRRWVRDKAHRERDLALHGEVSPDSGESASPAPPALSAILRGLRINGLDTQRALRRFGGDGTVFADVLRSYAMNTRPLLEDLREHLAAENFEEYAIAVHGIKGSSYGISAQEVGRMAAALEAAAKAGNLDAVRAGHPAFDGFTEKLLNDIERALEEIEAAVNESKPLAAEPDPALLDELRASCGAFDMDRVDRAMAKIESFRYERGGGLVAWLREQVGSMTFEAIASGEWPSE